MKNLVKTLRIVLVLLVVSILYQCNHHNKSFESQTKYPSPFKDIALQADNSLINPQASIKIRTSKGSVFSVPENAFVYEDGSVVKDSVNLKIKEFSSTAEILISGIPMTCDSGGKTFNFKSAGMFEIRGKCKGKDVYLAKDKKIDVDFSSAVSGDYNFYYLNDSTGKWETKGMAKAGTNEKVVKHVVDAKTQAKMDEKQLAKQYELKKVDKKKSVIDFDIDITNFPEINVYNGIVWQYADNNAYPDPDKNKWIFSTKWENFKLTALNENGEYELKLINKNKSFKTSVVPVLSEKNYQKAMVAFKKNMEKSNQQMADIQDEVNRKYKEEAVLRTFSISKMGIYNWDCLYKEPQFVAVKADFKFDKYTANDFNNITLFFITDNGRTVVKLPQNTWQQFAFNPDKANKIIAVLPENKVACFGSKDFSNIDVDKVKTLGSYQFVLKVSDKNITSSKSLEELLESI